MLYNKYNYILFIAKKLYLKLCIIFSEPPRNGNLNVHLFTFMFLINIATKHCMILVSDPKTTFGLLRKPLNHLTLRTNAQNRKPWSHIIYLLLLLKYVESQFVIRCTSRCVKNTTKASRFTLNIHIRKLI